MPEDRPTRSGNRAGGATLRWPLVIVALALIALVGYLATLREARSVLTDVGTAVSEVGEGLGEIAERFRSGTISTTFTAALPQLHPSGGMVLELATAEAVETFDSTDERRILWDRISLGETVAEIRVPVTYRYHVRLDAPWRLEVRDRTCIVHAPAIRASLPVAIATDRMQKRTEEGWFRFDGEQKLLELEQSITPTLAGYATDPRHLSVVRETGRAAVASFVRDWLLREDHWRTDRFHAIVVRFADEPEPAESDRAPTLTLDR